MQNIELMKQNFLVTSYIVNAYISENNRNWKSLLKFFLFYFYMLNSGEVYYVTLPSYEKKITHYFGEVYFVTFPSYVKKKNVQQMCVLKIYNCYICSVFVLNTCIFYLYC